MRNLKDIDITKRCGYKSTNTIHDFLEPLTTKKATDLMLTCISWEKNPTPLINAEGDTKKFTPHLNKPINKIPKEILKDLYGDKPCTDGVNFYLYYPCCM